MKFRFLLMFSFLFFLVPVFSQETEEGEQTEEEVEIDDIEYDEEADTIDWDEEADTIDIDDIDIDDIEEDEIASQSDFPWEKFAVGGQIGNLQFGDQTAISLAPEVVYSINPALAFGVDGIYELFKVNRLYTWNGYYDIDYKEENSGGRFFTRISPVQSFPVFAQLEYERLNQQNIYDYYQTETGEIVYPSVKQKLNNLGGGLGFNNGPYYLGLMYNFMNASNKDEFRNLASDDSQSGPRPLTPEQIDDRNYPNAITFRAGLNIPLGGGDKNKRRDNKKKKDSEEEFLPTHQ